MDDRIQELFDQAVVLPPEQRAAFLGAACAGDQALRAEVESLLACDLDAAAGGAGGQGLLESPVVRAPEPAPTRPAGGSPAGGWLAGPPARVGNYRVLRRIAEGGMGAVYQAE